MTCHRSQRPGYQSVVDLPAEHSHHLFTTKTYYRPERAELTSLTWAFQQELNQTLAGTWQLVTAHDRRWPATELVEGIRSVRQRYPGNKPGSVPPKFHGLSQAGQKQAGW